MTLETGKGYMLTEALVSLSLLVVFTLAFYATIKGSRAMIQKGDSYNKKANCNEANFLRRTWGIIIPNAESC